jgi:hypothetical protein
MKEFRRDPAEFVKNKLNPRLASQNRGSVVVESGRNAPILNWVKP